MRGQGCVQRDRRTGAVTGGESGGRKREVTSALSLTSALSHFQLAAEDGSGPILGGVSGTNRPRSKNKVTEKWRFLPSAPCGSGSAEAICSY